MHPRRKRLGAGSSLPAERHVDEAPSGAPAPAGADAAPATPPAQPRLLQLPYDLILEVGLQLDHLGDLHTLLRRTCKRLRAITEAPPRGVRASGGGRRDGHDSNGPDAGADDGSGGEQQPAGQQAQRHLGGEQTVSAPWPSAAGRVQAAWLLKWRGGMEPHRLAGDCADRGDGDVTLSLLGQLAATPGQGQSANHAVAVFQALLSASRHGASPPHERAVEAVFRSHGAAVAALGPRWQIGLLHHGSSNGSLALVGAMLGLGAGALPLDPTYRNGMQKLVEADEVLRGTLRLDCAAVTASDLTLAGAADGYHSGVLTMLLDAEQEGRVAVAPVFAVVAWAKTADAVSDRAMQRQRGRLLAAPLARLTGMLRQSVRDTVSSGCMPAQVVMGLVADRLSRVAANGGMELLEGMLGALPSLPLERRACAALQAARHGHAEAVSVLLAASPPHDPSSPCDANSMVPAVLRPTSLERVLRAAAVRGFTEAALAVLGAAGGAEGVCALVGSSGVLEVVARRGHASTVRALVARAGAGLWHEPLRAAAEAASEAGHTRLAGMLDRAAALARGRQESGGS